MHQMALSLEQARDRGALGMERAADRAERKSPGWSELAVNALRLHVQSLPTDREFIVEDIRQAIEAKLPLPPDLRSWGAVTQMALRRLYIVPTGNYHPAKSSNASPKPLYRRGGAI